MLPHAAPPRADLVLAAVLAVAGIAMLPGDLAAARWCLGGNCPDELKKLFSLSEVFAHGLGVLGILVTLWVVDPARRWALPRLLVISLGAGMCANLLKMVLSRSRPRELPIHTTSLADTFSGWLPLFGGGTGHSFPSAHTAAAFGLAIGLAWYFGRGRGWFLAVAILSGLQRAEVGAHFLSDICWGAATGCVAATSCLHFRPLVALLDRLERRLVKSARPVPTSRVVPAAEAGAEVGSRAA